MFFILLNFQKCNSYAKDFPINSFNSLKQQFCKGFDSPKLRKQPPVHQLNQLFRTLKELRLHQEISGTN